MAPFFTGVDTFEEILSMPPLEDRTRELCAKAVAANDDVALKKMITELRAAISEHINNARRKAAEVILMMAFKAVKRAA